LDDSVADAITRFRRDLPTRRLPGDDELYEQSEDTVRVLLQGYQEYWGTHGQRWHPLGNEVSGRVEVGAGTGVFLTFRSDKFVNYGGGLWIVDHKTAAKMDPREMMKYQMNVQVTAYIYGATKVLGTKVQGVIVDFLVKTKIPQYAREVFERTDEDLEAFEVEFVRWARQMQRDTLDAKELHAGKPWLAFPKNDHECFRYSTCPFRALCIDPSNPGLRQEFVTRKEDYVDNPALLSAGTTPGQP